MFWLARPPYGRWAAAGALMAIALLLDANAPETEPRPFAARDIAAGEALDEARVEWHRAPAGLLPEVVVANAVAVRAIAAGEPLTPSLVAHESPIPASWWSVELPLPSGTAPGTLARVVLVDPPAAIDGIVASVLEPGPFGGTVSGLVAVPPEHADAIARAAAAGSVRVLTASGP